MSEDCPHTNNQFGRCDQGKACQCAADEVRESLNDPERRKAIGNLLRKARAKEKGVFPNA